MKIALLGPAHPFRGGIVHFNSHLAKALRGRPELTVDLYYWTKPFPEFLVPGSVAAFLDKQSSLTFHLPGLPLLSYTNPFSWLGLIKRLYNGRYDLFITHWVHPVHFPIFTALFAAIRLLMKTEICLLVHNCLPHESLCGAAFMSRSVMKVAHRIVVHSDAEADKARSIGLAVSNIVTSFHPIFDQFVNVAEPPQAIRQALGLRSRVFLFFGFIRPYKGLLCLLEAFCDLAPANPDVSLLIVGEHFCKTEEADDSINLFLEKKAVNSSVRSQIVWINRYVANEEVGRYFVVADALVAPYLTATQSGPIQIAYAFDKPVIASDLPAFRQCVSPGESGYLFSAGSAEDLTKKMDHFLKQPITSDQVSGYRQRFSWDRYVDWILQSRGMNAK